MDQSASTLSPARSQRQSSRPTKQQLSLLEIQTLLSPLAEHPDSLFELLLSLVAKGPVEAEIPESLIQLQGRFFPVLLYSEDGVVRKVTGSHTFNKFFELVDLRLSSKAQKEKDAMQPGPKYCVRSQSRQWTYCRSREDCASRWDEMGQNQYLMRRHVRAVSIEPRIYRVVYREGNIRAFKLGNKERGGRSAERKSVKRVVSRVSIYQHSPADFHYAGKLLKESFSPYLPYPSRLSNKPSASLTSSPSHSHRLRPGKDQPEWANFAVNTENAASCSVTAVDQLKPELTALIRRFVTSVERLPRQTKIEEITLDCVKVDRGRFVMVDCLQISYGAASPQESEVKSLRQRFQQLTLTESLPKAPRPRVLTPLPRVQPAFVRRKLSEVPSMDLLQSVPVLSLPHSLSRTEVSRAAKHLSSVEAKYDGMVTRVRTGLQSCRNLERTLDSLKNHLGEDLLERVVKKLCENTLAKGVLERSGKELEAVKSGFLAVLRGETPYRRTKQSDKDTPSLLKVLETLFRQEGHSLEVPSDSLDQVLTRLDAFCLELTS